MGKIEKTPDRFSFSSIVQVGGLSVGLDFPDNQAGRKLAVYHLLEQQQQIIKKIPRVSSGTIRRDNPPMEKISIEAHQALEQGNYGKSLFLANCLYQYGLMDSVEKLGGVTYFRSFRLHREFASQIVRELSHEDPFLRQITALHGQIEDYRIVVHAAAINGTLGESARKQFDPRALVQIPYY